MVICGPCVVMMPPNHRYGPFQRKHTRIPLSNSRLSAIPSSTFENRRNTSKLPRTTSSTSKQVVRKPPSSSYLGKCSSTDNRSSLNVDSNIAQSSRGERATSYLSSHKPQKVESLVISNQDGKYVGTKYLKPVSTQKLGFCEPSIHSSSKSAVRDNVPPSSKLPRGNQPTNQKNQSKAASEDIYISTASCRSLDGTFDQRTAYKKCMPFQSHKLRSLHPEVAGTFIPSPSTFLLSNSTERSKNTQPNSSNHFLKSAIGGSTSRNIPRFSPQNFTQSRHGQTTIAAGATSPRQPFVSGANVDKGKWPNLRRTEYVLRNRKLGLIREKHLERKLICVNAMTIEGRQPPRSSSDDFKCDSGSPSSGSEGTMEFPKEVLQQHKLNDTQRSVGNEGKNDFKDLSGLEGSTNILDFSIESGEESAYDELMLKDETFDLDDENFDLQNENLTLDGVGSGSDEETTNQDAVTVINTGLMTHSDDTVIDRSMNSSEENIIELLNNSELGKEEAKSEKAEKREEPKEREEERESNPDASPDPSTDEFLVQSFQQLQQEVKKREHTETTESINFHNVSNNSRSFSGIQRRGSEPTPPKLSPLSEDESDYIDIDCDVQPMPPLNRPLVYGYGNRLPMRTRNVSQHYRRHSLHPDHFYANAEPQRKDCFSSKAGFKQTQVFPSMKETFWDYYLAKSTNEGIDRIEHPHSTTDLITPCHIARDCYYDPEILLAQVAHPKSLKNATFSEYSSHIKSSIMERYALQYSSNDFPSSDGMEYGSCIDLTEISQPVSANDPGYYSESDITKLKKIDYQTVVAGESENEDEYDDYYPLYPILPQHHVIQDQLQPAPKNPVSFLHQPRILPSSENFYGDRNISEFTEKKFIPHSNYGHIENPLSKPLGVNPWLHLLPDITPPRTPLKDLVPSGYENRGKISNSPFVTSLPLWTSGNCEENSDKTLKRNLDRKTMEAETIVSQTRTKDTRSPPKSSPKSFLTFFRKKNSTLKSNKQVSKSKPSENVRDRRFSQLLPAGTSVDHQNQPISSNFATESKRPRYPHFASPKLSQILRKSVSTSEKSNSSSSSSSSSTKSSHSTTSQDSVLTVISAKCS